MATVLTREKKAAAPEIQVTSKSEPSTSKTSLDEIPSLGVPIEERRFWWQRAKAYDPDAIATQV